MYLASVIDEADSLEHAAWWTAVRCTTTSEEFLLEQRSAFEQARDDYQSLEGVLQDKLDELVRHEEERDTLKARMQNR